jgi:hypothetical protein
LSHPFTASSLSALVVKIVKSKPPPIPAQYSPKLRLLVDSMLQKQPKRRPTLNQVLALDFIKERINQLLSTTREKLSVSRAEPTRAGRLVPRGGSKIPVRRDPPKPPEPAKHSPGRLNELSEKQQQKKNEIEQRQKEREAERSAKFREHQLEEARRRKQFEKLEAPFKAKKGTVKTAPHGQEPTDGDLIQIGKMVIDVREGADDVADAADEAELESFAEVAAQNCESAAPDEEDEAQEPAKFFFKGVEIPLRATSLEERLEEVRAFIEKGLPDPDTFQRVIQLIVDEPDGMSQEEADKRLREVLTTDEQFEYLQVIRQYALVELGGQEE